MKTSATIRYSLLPILYSLFSILYSLILSPSCFAAGAWRNVGPGGGGCMLSLEFSRHHPDRLYLGCDVGGFYRSEDRGKRFEICNKGLCDLRVDDIVEHPTEPETLLVAAHGVYKSVDGGRSWKENRTGLPPLSSHSFGVLLSRLAYNEKNPDEVYATVGKPENRVKKPSPVHLYLSTDGGESWNAVATKSGIPDEAFVNDFAVDPRDFRRFVAATTCGLYRSDDGGVNWMKAAGLPHEATMRVVRAPSNPNIVYVSLQTRDVGGQWAGGVYCSDDGGKTFVERNGGLKRDLVPNGGMRCSGYQALLVDPENPDGVYLGGMSWTSSGLYRTEDGGRNWKRCTPPEHFRKEPGDGWHGVDYSPSVYSMSRSPFDAKTFVFGTEFALDITEDGGKTWNQRYTAPRTDGKSESTGLEVTCVREILPDPVRPGCCRFAYLDIGTWTTRDGGKTVEATFVNDNHSTWGIAQSPTEPDLLWQFCGRHGPHASSVERFLVSRDGARTWQRAMARDYDFLRTQTRDLVCVSRQAPYRLLARNTSKGLVASDDGGATWELVPTNVLPVARTLSRLAFIEGTVYACGLPNARQTGSLWRSCDLGRTWERVPGPTEHFGTINDVAVSGRTLFVASGDFYAKEIGARCKGALWLSEDGGQTWRSVYEARSCRCCAISKGRLLLGIGYAPYFDHYIEGGVLMSEDHGQTWLSLVDESLMNGSINDIAVDASDPDRIWVATQGNSVFTRRLPKTSVAPFKDGDRVVFPGDSIRRNVVAFNEDDSHFLNFDRERLTEKGASDYLDSVIGGGKITHFFFCPGAQVANFDSQTRDTSWKHLDEPGYVCYKFATNGCYLSKQGVDVGRIWTDGCRRRGVSPWLSMRMNDMHDAKLPLSCLHSDFWRAHPEYRFGMGQFDYRHPEVRADMLRFMGECLARYDVDGIECDWLRWTRHLSNPKRDAKILTDFMREVRKLADAAAAKRGHAVRVGVRVKSRPDAAVEQGTDAVAWAKEGLVDWIVPCNFFQSVDFDMPVAEWKRLLGPAAAHTLLVAGMDAGKVIWDESNSRWSGRRQLTAEEYCGFANRMYGRGADGISVFNLFTYDHMPRWNDGPWKFVTQTGLAPETVRSHPHSIPEKFFYER